MPRPDCCNYPTSGAEWQAAFGRRLFCRRCRHCLRHVGCVCQKCRYCGKQVEPKAACGRCWSCKIHHQERIFRVGEFPFRHCVYEPDPPTTFLLNPLQRSLGVEVELEQFKGLTQADCRHITYRFEHDGSVAMSGKELVTEKLTGDRFITGMSELAAAINTKKCVAGASTGLHVHVDAIDYSPLDLRRMFVLFALMQDQLFGTLVAADRRHNQFCPPLRGTKAELQHLLNLTRPSDINKFFYKYLYGIDYPTNLSPAEQKSFYQRIERSVKELKTKKYVNSARRQALNFHSWMMRGTLEFRLHEGTTDPADLVMWPLWCGWMVQKVISTQLSDKEIGYWIAKGPPTVLELSERFAEGRIAMPKNIVEWVRTKCATPTKAKKTPELCFEEEYAVPASEQATSAPPGDVAQRAYRAALSAGYTIPDTTFLYAGVPWFLRTGYAERA